MYGEDIFIKFKLLKLVKELYNNINVKIKIDMFLYVSYVKVVFFIYI